MAEYIERTEELMLAMNAGARAIEQTKKYHGSTYVMDCFSDDERSIPYLRAAAVLRGSSETQAADVAPVRHGYWVVKYGEGYWNKIYKCSECYEPAIWDGGERDDGWVLTKCCPNCGAIMDGVRHDD